VPIPQPALVRANQAGMRRGAFSDMAENFHSNETSAPESNASRTMRAAARGIGNCQRRSPRNPQPEDPSLVFVHLDSLGHERRRCSDASHAKSCTSLSSPSAKVPEISFVYLLIAPSKWVR